MRNGKQTNKKRDTVNKIKTFSKLVHTTQNAQTLDYIHSYRIELFKLFEHSNGFWNIYEDKQQSEIMYCDLRLKNIWFTYVCVF